MTQEHRFIFVAGLHRSGTSLTFRTLRDHSKISGFRFPMGAEKGHEGQHRQSVYPPDTQNGGVGYFCFEPKAHLTESSTLATPANAKRLFDQWSQFWDLSKPYLLEKSPPNLIMTRFLQHLFPETYFVVIVRHPVAVSLATLKWMGWPRHFLDYDAGSDANEGYRIRRAVKSDNPLFMKDKRLFMESMLFTLFDHWRAAHEIFLDDREYLKRVSLIRYEDLVSEPESTIARLFEFLELENENLPAEDQVEDHNAGYMSQWTDFLADEANPRFKSLIGRRFNQHFEKFGYSVSDQMVRQAALT